MSRSTDSLEAARQAAVAQRQRLRLRLAATRDRLTPARLKFDARQEAERRIRQGATLAAGQARAHPLWSGLGVAAIIAWAFREPLMQHGPERLRAAYDWLTGHLAFSNDDLSADAPEDGPEDGEAAAPADAPPPASGDTLD